MADNETVADVVREWHVTDCGACIRSHDFTHDVVLNLSGDFADTDERITYAEHIANTLNSEAAHAREIESLQRELDNERARGVHTCSIYCDRPLCVALREIASLRQRVEAFTSVADAMTRDAVSATASGQTCFVPRYQLEQLSAAISAERADTRSGRDG